MIPNRLSVKLFVANGDDLDLNTFVPVFQRWIQQQTVEGLLIDVANYAHMATGPGVMLVGDEADYAIDERDDKTGLLYTRKRHLGDDLQAALRNALRLAVLAAQQLEAEPALDGLQFNYNTVKVELIDRLHYPNTPETLEQARTALETFAGVYTGETSLSLAHDDPREVFAVNITAQENTTAETLLASLAGVGA